MMVNVKTKTKTKTLESIYSIRCGRRAASQRIVIPNQQDSLGAFQIEVNVRSYPHQVLFTHA